MKPHNVDPFKRTINLNNVSSIVMDVANDKQDMLSENRIR
jgi:hypothetical protein